MIKVIKYGNKRRTYCGNCGALLEFEKEDIKVTQAGINEYEEKIKCPACGENIVVGRYS